VNKDSGGVTSDVTPRRGFGWQLLRVLGCIDIDLLAAAVRGGGDFLDLLRLSEALSILLSDGAKM
jgi:hypothetical protein